MLSKNVNNKNVLLSWYSSMKKNVTKSQLRESCMSITTTFFSHNFSNKMPYLCILKIQTKLLGNNSRIVLFRKNQSIFECRWPADQIQDLKFGRTVYIRRKQCRSLDVNEVTEIWFLITSEFHSQSVGPLGVH